MKELKNAECVVVLQKTDDDGDRTLVQIPVKKEVEKETFEKQLKKSNDDDVHLSSKSKRKRTEIEKILDEIIRKNSNQCWSVHKNKHF
jgi:predicted nucleotidyltransferase